MAKRKKYENLDFALLILRLGSGLSMAAFHGYGKLVNEPESWVGLGQSMALFGIHFLPGVFGFLAMAAEFFGGLLVAVGLLTRYAAAALLFTMMVAAAVLFNRGANAGDFGEIILYASSFICLLLTGPGRLSVAAWQPKK